MENTVETVTAPHFEKYAAAEQGKAERMARVENDRELSPEGKAKRLREVSAQFEAEAAQIQGAALAAIEDKIGVLSRDAAREKAETSKTLRAEIGDAVYSEFLKADISDAATPEDVRRLFDEAAPGFDRTVCGLAALQRLKGFENNSHARQAASEIRAALYGEKQTQRQRTLEGLTAAREDVQRRINPHRENELRQRFKL